MYNWRNAKIVDVYNIYMKMEPRTLSATYERFTGKTLENAHSATADIEATIEIFNVQLEKYEIEKDVEAIDKISKMDEEYVDLAGKFKYNEKGELCITFGKHKDKNVVEVYSSDKKYFDWMLSSDFSLETKMIIKKIKEKLDKKV